MFAITSILASCCASLFSIRHTQMAVHSLYVWVLANQWIFGVAFIVFWFSSVTLLSSQDGGRSSWRNLGRHYKTPMKFKWWGDGLWPIGPLCDGTLGIGRAQFSGVFMAACEQGLFLWWPPLPWIFPKLLIPWRIMTMETRKAPFIHIPYHVVLVETPYGCVELSGVASPVIDYGNAHDLWSK